MPGADGAGCLVLELRGGRATRITLGCLHLAGTNAMGTAGRREGGLGLESLWDEVLTHCQGEAGSTAGKSLQRSRRNHPSQMCPPKSSDNEQTWRRLGLSGGPFQKMADAKAHLYAGGERPWLILAALGPRSGLPSSGRPSLDCLLPLPEGRPQLAMTVTCSSSGMRLRAGTAPTAWRGVCRWRGPRCWPLGAAGVASGG